jgi:hypothetical protein
MRIPAQTLKNFLATCDLPIERIQLFVVRRNNGDFWNVREETPEAMPKRSNV